MMILYVLLFVLELTLWLFVNPLRRREYAKLGINTSSRYVLNLLKLPMGAIDRFSSGELAARYSSIRNVTAAMERFTYLPVMIVRPVLCTLLLMLYSWKLGLVVVLSMLSLVMVMRATSRSIKKNARLSSMTGLPATRQNWKRPSISTRPF